MTSSSTLTKHTGVGPSRHLASVLQTRLPALARQITPAPPWTTLLYTGILIYILLVARLWSATAHSHGESEYLQSIFMTSTAALLAPSVAAVRFSILFGSGMDELDAFDPDSTDFLRYAALPSLPALYAAGLMQRRGFTLVHLYQFGLEDISPLPLDLQDTAYPGHTHTAARLHGTIPLRSKSLALHYTVAVGLSTEKVYDVAASARFGYHFGTNSVTLGVEYFTHGQAMGRDGFQDIQHDYQALLSNSDVRSMMMHVLYHKDRLIGDTKLSTENEQNEEKIIAVRRKPVLNINQQWMVFYRFDRFNLHHNMLSITEHVIGVRFLAVSQLYLRAEVMMKHVSSEPQDAGGFRLAGILRF